MNLNKIKSFVCALMLPMVTFAAEDNVCLRFSTQGPDRYLDGNAVVDGEVYALVASKDGEFKGFNANGTVIDSGNDYVAVLAPVAKNGKCPPTWFQVRKEDPHLPAWAFSSGKWGIFLLDTRLVDGTVNPDQMGQVNGYCLVGEMVSLTMGVEEIASNASTVTMESTVPDLKIVDAKVVHGVGEAKLFQIEVVGVPPGGKCVVKGKDKLEAGKSKEKPVDESKIVSGRMVLRIPIDDNKNCQFYSVMPEQKGLEVAE